jgi:ankyrin repeat protein
LLDNGADINIADGGGQTPLHWASITGNSSIARKLLDKGVADVNAVSGQGFTALMLAAQGGAGEVVNALVEKGADQTKTCPDGKTAGEYAKEAGHKEIAAQLGAGGGGGCVLL